MSKDIRGSNDKLSFAFSKKNFTFKNSLRVNKCQGMKINVL